MYGAQIADMAFTFERRLFASILLALALLWPLYPHSSRHPRCGAGTAAARLMGLK
jgi:hypothetical protein